MDIIFNFKLCLHPYFLSTSLMLYSLNPLVFSCRDMRHKLHTWAVTFAFLLALQLLGSCVAVQCVDNHDTTYADCETNFTTLENALIHTCDNSYNLWTTFFPPRETQSLFVVVKYQIINSNTSIDYIWTTAAFTLIHPPRIFGMISLFFGFVEEDRIQNVTIRLPESCLGLLTPEYGRTNEEAKSNFLEVLTQRVSIATPLLHFYQKGIITSTILKSGAYLTK